MLHAFSYSKSSVIKCRKRRRREMKEMMIVAGLFTIVLLRYFVIKEFQYTPQTAMNQTEEQNSEQEDVINDDYREYGTDKVQDQIEYMALDEKIGQLFITDISGTELTDKKRDKFERNSLEGVIFFVDNFDYPRQAVQL